MSFLWRWSGDPAIELPPTGSATRDQPASNSTGKEATDFAVTVSDEEKWKQSLARMRPDIKPTDTDFTNKKADFDSDISSESGLSIDRVLQQHFSRYEVRKLSEYVDQNREPHLHAQQKEDAAAYKVILQSEAWKSEEGRVTLSTKLTMAYFGFPVEPLMLNDLFPGLNSNFFNNIINYDTASDDDGMFVPEDKRPLRFLNNYDKRGWGKDNSHMMPNQTFEGYYRLPSIPPNGDKQNYDQQERSYGPMNAKRWNSFVPGMRGGGLSSGDEASSSGTDDDYDDDAKDDASVVSHRSSSMEDIQYSSGSDSNHAHILSLRGGEGPIQQRPELDFLYGFSGRQIWHPTLPSSFFDAVDALLALRNRQSSTGSGIPLTVAFLVCKGQVKDQWYGECKKIVRGQIGQYAQQEQDFFDEVQRVRSEQLASINDDTSRVVLFVCYQYQERTFRDGQGTWVAFRPNLDGDTCFQFSLQPQDPEEAYPAAYLWKPANIDHDTASNHYEEWFRAVWRTLSLDGIDFKDDGSLGRTRAKPPKSCFLNIGDVDFHSQMPLPRKSWDWLVDQFNAGNRQFCITTEPGQYSVCSVPGFYEIGLKLEPEEVFALAWGSVPEADRDTVVRIDVKPWDVPFDAKDPKLVRFRCQGGAVLNQDNAYEKNVSRLDALLNQRRALLIQPRWRQYRAHILDDDGKKLVTLNLALDILQNDWPQALMMIKSEFERANQWQDNAVICIDQGNPCLYERISQGKMSESDKTMERLLRNRTSHDFEPMASPEMQKLWQRFVHLVSFNHFEVYLKEKVDQSGNPGIGDPWGLKTMDPDDYPWGYNVPLFAKPDQPAATDAEDADMGNVRVPAPGRETQQEVDTRATGLESSEIDRTELSDIGLAKVLFQRDQLPSSLPLDSAQRGKAFREWSYGQPLSINMSNQHPEFPINAPPLENIIKQRGPNGLVSSSLPTMSTQILTPTEQRRLQESFFQMRSIALNRGQMCPHKGCRAYFPVDPNGMVKFHAHLEQKHIKTHCPFCTDTLFAHWQPEQKQKHFVEKHSEYFTRKGDLLKEARLAEGIESKGLVHRREEQYNFCPRCGRNHNILNSKADRTQHDNVCFPGNNTRDANMTYCTFCGDPELTGTGAPGSPWQAHICQVPREPGTRPASDAFCKTCALPCSRLGMSYARRHLLHCKSSDTARDSWCPWCGIDLKSGPRKQRLQHLKDCGLKPFTGEDPVCTETGQPKESPRDNQEVLRRSFFKPTTGPGYDRVVIPKICPVAGCQQDLSLLNAHGLYRHFKRNHTEGTNNMTHCPFCQVDFVARKWALSKEKEDHFQDHIDQRYERIMADETISKSNDWESQDVKEAFVKRDQNYLDPTTKIQKLQEDTVSLTKETYRLTRENQKLRQAAQEVGTKTLETANRRQQQPPQPTVVAPSATTANTNAPPRKPPSTPVLPPSAGRSPRKLPETRPQSQQSQPGTIVPPATPEPTQQPTPGNTGPARTQAQSQASAQSPARVPARFPAWMLEDKGPASKAGDSTLKFTEVSDDDKDDYVPISRSSSRSARRSDRARNRAVNDPPYKPDAGAPDDEDDNFQEGLVAEFKPDLGISMRTTPPTPRTPPMRQTPQTAARAQDNSSSLAQYVPPPASGTQPKRAMGSGKRLAPTTGSPSKKQRTSSEQAPEVRAPSTLGTSRDSPSRQTRKSPARSGAAGTPSSTSITSNTGDAAKPTSSERSALG
ncbi:hypothetical protein VMCG_10465 [Cytospora schulzeri]|uniref:Uncharacterized protein n=1 Tax=Cytospora schulzeri TaxID=448051 RepID=A0A423VBX0_9PEZI|nr:hypothetical protein VMCG_10465 [Valsa malicola]